MEATAVQVGECGTIIVPDDLRRHFGIEEGALVTMEANAEGILIRLPGVAFVEIYTPQHQAEFLLSNAVDMEDYAHAVVEVHNLGIDPATIPHHKPAQE